MKEYLVFSAAVLLTVVTCSYCANLPSRDSKFSTLLKWNPFTDANKKQETIWTQYLAHQDKTEIQNEDDTEIDVYTRDPFHSHSHSDSRQLDSDEEYVLQFIDPIV